MTGSDIAVVQSKHGLGGGGGLLWSFHLGLFVQILVLYEEGGPHVLSEEALGIKKRALNLYCNLATTLQTYI